MKNARAKKVVDKNNRRQGIVYKNEKPHLENTDSYIIQAEEMIYGEKTAIKVILI